MFAKIVQIIYYIAQIVWEVIKKLKRKKVN